MRTKTGAFTTTSLKLVGKVYFTGDLQISQLCLLHTDKLATCQLNQANYFFF